MADFEKPFNHRRDHSKQFNNSYYTKIFLLVFVIIIGIYIYINRIIENYKWSEPTELFINGGEKHLKAFSKIATCMELYNTGYNMHTYQRWKQTQQECIDILYYMRYGGF